MADDIQSNIRIGIDTTDAISSIKNLQRKISAFHTTMAQGSAANAAAAANLQRNLLDSINATGKFSANITKIRSTTESFTDSLEKNKFSIGQYFKYAAGASKSFGKIFSNEFATIDKVARERVKSLQTQYIKIGRDANGALQAIKVRPLVLDMNDLATKTAIAAQKQQLLNQLLKQGSTNLLNFGKNTQWAGRQLMVGFTIPLSIFGTTAAKTFMQMEEQAIRFKRVYGEMFTTDAESEKMLKNIKRVASEFTKYGVAVEKTMGLAADAAAMGKQGNDLIAQVREANRLAVLGQVEQAQALETTISVTNAFGTAAEDLAGKIDFLNAVENQTVTSIEDLTIAVPKAGPVVKQLGGDVEDLAFFLTAMKEGGINASEGANALKSGLASIINPTKKATEMLAGYGINVTKIVESNKGDVKGTVVDFATALDKLDPLKRARAIEQLFGKFQFARLSTLFKNVIGEGTQAQRVLDLAASTSGDLAKLSAKELSRVSESPMYKFKKAIEDIKAALAPVGEIFLKLATPLIEFGTKVLNAFNSLDEKTKSFVTGLIAVVGGLGPVLLMTFGLLANGVANIIKGFVFVKNIFNKTTAASKGLGGQLDYMTQSQLDAAAIAGSLDQSHSKLIQTFSSEAGAVNMLTAAYRRSIAAQGAFTSVPAISRTRPQRLSSGIISVPGPKGAGDIVPAMLSPEEAVIPAKPAKKYRGLLQGIIADNVPGYEGGYNGDYKKPHKAHLQGALDTAEPEVRKQILELYPEFDSMPQELRDNVSFSGSLVAELSNTLNQQLKRKRKGVAVGADINVFDSAWNAIEDKLLSSAVAGGMDPNDAEARKALKEIEVNVGKKAVELARKAGTGVTDAILEAATNEILDQSKTVGGKTEKVARQLESRKKVLGDVRGRFKKADYQRLLANGTLVLRGQQIVDPVTGIVVGDYRTSKSGRNSVGYKQKAQSISKFGGYTTTPSMATVVNPQSALMTPQTTQVAAVKKIAILEADARVEAEKAILGKEENDPLMLQRSEQRNSPHPQAGIDGADDAKARIAAEQREYKRQSRRVTAVPAGNGQMQVVASPAISQANATNTRTPRRVVFTPPVTAGTGTVMDAQGKVIEKATKEMAKIEPAVKKASFSIRGLSYALSSLSTAALMSGQLTGDFGNAVLGATYGLTAMTEIANIARTTGAIGLSGKLQGPLMAGKTGVTGSKISDFFSRMINVGGKAVMTVGRFAGIVGIAITVISGFVMLAKFINDQREKERLKIEGLGDAATLTAEKLKAIGNFYGKEPVKTAFAGAGSSIGPATAEKRATVNTLSSNKEFQEAFKTDIAVLKKATVKQTKQAFETLSLSLFAQGYDKKTVQDIIDTLRKEAGKTKVTFDVASIDIKTKGGKAAFKKSVDTMVKDYQAAFDKGYKKELYVETSGNMVTGQGYKNTKDFDANLDTTAANLSERINALQTLFDNGQISLKDYTTNMNLLKKAMTEGKGSTELAQKVFKNFVDAIEDPAIKKLIGNVQGASNQFLIMQATMTGVITTADELAKALEAINIITDYQKNGDKSKYSFSQYRQAIQDVTALGKAVAANSKEQEKLNEEAKDYGTGDGTGDESVFTKAKKDIEAQTKEIKNQIDAFRKLKAVGIETDKAFEMASNSMFAAAIAAETVGTAKWKELINLWNTLKAKQKALDAAESKTLDGKVKNFEEGYSKVQEAFSAYEEQANAAFKNANKKDLDLITQTESKISALNYKLEGYQSILDDIQLKEDEINETYDKKIEALNTVAKINERLIAQQKSQLTIADALTRGDISAAAVAIQDQQSQQASASAQEQTDLLESARKAALGGVTVNGKTRLEIEKQIRDTSAEIKKLEIETLRPAAERIRLADEKLQADIKAYKVSGSTKDEWDLIAGNIALAKTNTDSFITSLKAALTASKNLGDALSAKTTAKVAPKAPASTGVKVPVGGGYYIDLDTGKTIKAATGGYISGPGTGTSDSIPARLSDGEYVVKASAVKNVGVDVLDRINSGRRFAASGSARGTDIIPAMPTPEKFVIRKSSVDNIGVDSLRTINRGASSGESVYNNYELNVNVRSDSDANDIARTVMAQIRQIDSQRVRGIRL